MMTKNEIADAALRAAGRKRVNDEAMALALRELEEVVICCNQTHLKEFPPSFVHELTEKLTKRLILCKLL
jgi:hypothetical protein